MRTSSSRAACPGSKTWAAPTAPSSAHQARRACARARGWRRAGLRRPPLRLPRRPGVGAGPQADPTVTVTRFAPPRRAAAASARTMRGDHTTFVASAGSFLDIFCVDRAAAQEDEVNPAEAPPPPARAGAGQAPAWQGGHDGGRPARRAGRRRRCRPGETAALADAAERTGAGRRAGRPPGRRAAARSCRGCSTAATWRRPARWPPSRLARDPDNAELRALGTEALLRSDAAAWMAQLKARRFDRAAQAVAQMRKLAGTTRTPARWWPRSRGSASSNSSSPRAAAPMRRSAIRRTRRASARYCGNGRTSSRRTSARPRPSPDRAGVPRHLCAGGERPAQAGAGGRNRWQRPISWAINRE
jgi:hypothetical protein